MKNRNYQISVHDQMKTFRILIIEDNSSYRKLLRETLQKSFPMSTLDEATGERTALQKIETFIPDLIFMDIRLREENGLELTRKIKTIHPHIVVFVITAYGTPEYQKAVFETGADSFLPKDSFSAMELQELIELGSVLSEKLRNQRNVSLPFILG